MICRAPQCVSLKQAMSQGPAKANAIAGTQGDFQAGAPGTMVGLEPFASFSCPMEVEKSCRSQMHGEMGVSWMAKSVFFDGEMHDCLHGTNCALPFSAAWLSRIFCED